MKRPYRSKTIKAEISFAAKIPVQSIAKALRGQESEHFQEAVRVLDIVLRQNAANQYVQFCSVVHLGLTCYSFLLYIYHFGSFFQGLSPCPAVIFPSQS